MNTANRSLILTDGIEKESPRASALPRNNSKYLERTSDIRLEYSRGIDQLEIRRDFYDVYIGVLFSIGIDIPAEDSFKSFDRELALLYCSLVSSAKLHLGNDPIRSQSGLHIQHIS
jgi:hypothetical protein